VSQGTLFELHVGMQVNLRRFGGFVTEPESDDAGVHAALEQGHRSRVPQPVRLDMLRGERGAGAARRADMSRDKPLKRIGAEMSTAYAWENGVGRLSTSFC
jgi:hypothetical protein